MASVSRYQTKSGAIRWRVRFRDVSGRERSRSFVLRKDAGRFRLEMERRRQLGALFETPTEAFGTFADAWLDRWEVAKRPAPSTLEGVKRNVRLHLAVLRSLPIERISAAVFEDAIVAIARTRPRTAQHAFETGRRVLRDARDRGQTVDEAVFRLSPPKYDERMPVFLGVDELRHLASHSSESCLIEFAGLSGLRMGEIAALIDSDLDLDARVLVVQRAGYRGTGWNRTKTEQSVRRVYLSEHATELLREQLGSREAGPWVFPDEEGRQWSKRALYRRFEKAARRSGRPEMHFHDLRHTFVSLMAKANALPAEIARHLGHVDGGVLVSSRYQHLFPDALEGAQHRLDQLIADSDAGSVRDRVVSKAQKPRKQAVRRDGRTWDRTRDLSRVKRALSR